MFRYFLLLFAGCTFALTGCSPTYNWRDIRWDRAELKMQLPCKPDQGSRQMTLAGQQVEIEMMGCEAGAALFAIAHIHLGDPDQAAVMLSQWQAAMLGNMQAKAVQIVPYTPKGVMAQRLPARLSAQGQRQDGSPVEAQVLWFSRGPHLYQAVIYADKPNLEAIETFFAGIELQ
jgi:hypothetical protein